MASSPVADQALARWNSKITSTQLRAGLLDTIAIGIMAFLARVPFFGVAMHVDEGGYAYTAYWWAHGQRLYEQLWFDRPQGIFIVYRLIFALIGYGTLHIRIAAALAGVFAAWFVYLIARRLFDRQIAILAGLIFAVVSACPQIEGFTGNAETFMIVPAIIALYLFIRGKESDNWIWFVLAGLAGSVAVLIKPSELSTLLLLAALSYTWMQRNRIRTLALIATGFAAGIIPSIIHGYIIGGSNYFFCVVGYRLMKDSLATRGVSFHAEHLYRGLQDVVPGIGLLIGIAAWVIIQQYRAKNTQAIWVPLLWIATSIAGIAMGGNWYRHYFLQIVGPLAVVCAYGLVTVFRQIPAMKRPAFVFSSAVVFAAAIAISFSVLLIRDQRALSLALFHFDQYRYDAEIVDYLKLHSNPEDKMFVMYMDPEIIYLSGKQSAFPHLFEKEFDRIPDVDGKLVKVLTDPTTRPRFIVDLRAYGDHGEVHKDALRIIRENYVTEKRFGIIFLYRLKDQLAMSSN